MNAIKRARYSDQYKSRGDCYACKTGLGLENQDKGNGGIFRPDELSGGKSWREAELRDALIYL